MINELPQGRQLEMYQNGTSALGLSLTQAAWGRGQFVLSAEQGDNYFGQEDEEDFDQANEGQGPKIGMSMVNLDSIMGQIAKNVINSAEGQGGATGISGGVSGGNAPEKSIRDVLEERDEQLKNLEQLQNMKSSAFVDALAQDLDSNTTSGTVIINKTDED